MVELNEKQSSEAAVLQKGSRSVDVLVEADWMREKSENTVLFLCFRLPFSTG